MNIFYTKLYEFNSIFSREDGKFIKGDISMTNRTLMLFIVVTQLLIPLTARAYDPSWPKASDMPFLPPYCKAKMIDGRGSPQYEQWRRTLGKGFEHIHHYCAGLNFLRRADGIISRGSDERALLQQVVGQFDYVLKHAPQDFVLNPEILVRRGKVYERLKRSVAALNDFKKALELNPKYVYGYMALSDHYKDIGEREKARKTIESGLQIAPNSKGLKRRLKEIGN